MTASVYKYQLSDNACQVVEMPVGAQPLSAAMQGETLCVWAQIDKQQTQMTERKFWVFGTGHTIPDDFEGQFVDTAFDGPFVWHVFTDPEATN